MTEDRKAQAAATRMRNQEALARRYEEQAESIRTARLALQRVIEANDASVEQVLESARLLVELVRR